MKAGEFLKKLSVNPFMKYTGVYTKVEGRLVPFTTAKPDIENNLVFFRQNKKPPLAMKNLYTILLLHENKPLYFWNGGKVKVYSYDVVDGKIVF
ncbi:hypothetical protein NRIC_19830 [Enterococcus florum]|uniref:Uncharacterized protein n=1 Tax=Enterococcus florum TaxID=2480627 RepID=A0A4P5PEN1_9ENTE|nr:hypothetical protein [Enterococcus florum]GCF94092.1 hypothetical protein NRIC_19830 [Enterococcus florum]